jgi:hypothetical protein
MAKAIQGKAAVAAVGVTQLRARRPRSAVECLASCMRSCEAESTAEQLVNQLVFVAMFLTGFGSISRDCIFEPLDV